MFSEINITPLQQEAFNHYKKNTMSIEILKDDNLQKVNFRVKNKNVLRDEVKEKMTWSVDRSSPSNKIRDLMKWSKDILKDIYYQRKILSNPIATFFTKNWLFWNRMCILLSLAINALMLATWNARATLQDGKNSSYVPAAVYDPRPVVQLEQYDVIIYALGGAHNFFAFLVLVTYFLSNHPTLPAFSLFRKLFSKCKRTNKENPEKDKEDKEIKIEHEEKPKEKEEHESKLEVQLFSVSTLYYLIFLGLSVAGTIFQGYFFAFHLLNIVNNNQLLRGVIQAVTQNGKSLVWVAVLGLIVFYLYALISFAMLRSSFSTESNMYCATLWQCTITVIRYGLIGDIFEALVSHPSENTFLRFGFLVIFHLSFFIFITTIGLNIIFGIIVDTFSELRDLKWQAERDMRDTCFICSRGSYDFEHHGKGFEHHINVEHHIWAYIFFFIHLHDTKQSDYTALELHVFKLLQYERYDFFPLNRALSLSAMDEDSTESKVDDLLRFVMTLVERQKEEDARKKREEERQKQLRWREEHRNALLQGGDSMDTQDSNGLNSKLNRRPSGGRQRFRQKRWQRGSKSQYGMGDSMDTQDTLDSSLSMGKILTAGKDGLMDSTDDPPDNNVMDTSGASELEARSPSPRGHPGALTTSSPTPLDGSLPLDDDGVHLIDFGADGEPLQRDELAGSRLRSRSRTPSPPNIDDIMGTMPTLPRRGSRSAMSDMGGPPYRQPSLRAPQQPSIRSQPASRQASLHSRTPPLPSPQPPSATHSRPASSHASSQTSSRPRTPPIPTPHSMSRSSSHRSIPTPPKMTADLGVQTSDEEDETIPPPPPEETDIDDVLPLPPPAHGEYRSDDDDDDIPFGRSELKSTRV